MRKILGTDLLTLMLRCSYLSVDSRTHTNTITNTNTYTNTDTNTDAGPDTQVPPRRW